MTNTRQQQQQANKKKQHKRIYIFTHLQYKRKIRVEWGGVAFGAHGTSRQLAHGRANLEQRGSFRVYRVTTVRCRRLRRRYLHLLAATALLHHKAALEVGQKFHWLLLLARAHHIEFVAEQRLEFLLQGEGERQPTHPTCVTTCVRGSREKKIVRRCTTV